MRRDIHVKVVQGMTFDGVDIFFYQDTEDGFAVLHQYLDENGNCDYRWDEYDEIGSLPPATFRIPGILARRGGIQNLVDAIYDITGIRASDREDLTESAIKARDAHLEDLRRILFNFDWVELQRGEPIKPSGEAIIEREPPIDKSFEVKTVPLSSMEE